MGADPPQEFQEIQQHAADEGPPPGEAEPAAGQRRLSLRSLAGQVAAGNRMLRALTKPAPYYNVL